MAKSYPFVLEPVTSAAGLAQAAELFPARRLLVVVSNVEGDEAGVAKQVWALAAPRGLSVLFLGLCNRPDEESRLRRRLATLAAITRDEKVAVETHLVIGRDAIRRVLALWQAGDIVVCHAEQHLGMGRRPLAKALVQALQAPVITLTGFYPPVNVSGAGLIKRLADWAIPLLTIIGFMGLQIWVDRLPKSWVHTALFYLAVAGELAVIWVWQRLAF